MSMELRSGSWITPRMGVDKWDRLIKPQMMKTKRSSTIATLMMHFRQHAQLEYTKEDLTNLGIEVTYLSNADELLTDEGPFRPHWPFKPGVLKEAMHGKDVRCLAVEGIQQFYDDIESRGFGSMGFWFPWRIIETNEKFYGIVDGLGEDIEGSPRHTNPRLTVSAWCERRAPYLEPEVSKSLEVLPPHIHIKSYNQYHDVEELTRYELTAAVTSIYNRLYQKGFGYDKVFPVILSTICPTNRARMTEFVFDRRREKLSLRITPIHEFDDPETAPWETFIRMYASTPRVAPARKK